MLVDKILALAAAIGADIKSLTSGLANKVDKVSGKGLSSNDYTTAEKNKLAALTGNSEMPEWTTATRPATSGPVKLGFNTDFGCLEYWNGVDWMFVIGNDIYWSSAGVADFGDDGPQFSDFID